MKVLDAAFVTSVADGGVLPADTAVVVALAGRSNVGKSSLVNTLLRRRVARAGAKPGTTRLLNVYRVRAAGGGATLHFSLVDLPGYGYARGGDRTRRDFDALTRRFFTRLVAAPGRPAAAEAAARLAGTLLVVDIRHPGLDNDRGAHVWLRDQGSPVVVVATKGDRLSRSGRSRAQGGHEAAFGCPVLPVSSRTGDGIGPLWSTLARLVADRAR